MSLSDPLSSRSVEHIRTQTCTVSRYTRSEQYYVAFLRIMEVGCSKPFIVLVLSQPTMI